MNEDFLREIPKTDIHVHLDGSVRLGTLIELSKLQGLLLPTYDESELRQKYFNGGYQNLENYLEGFKYTLPVMQDASSIQRIAYEFAVDNYTEGVRYFEVRFAPQLHASTNPSDNFSMTDVFKAVNDGLLKAKLEFNAKLVEENRLNEPKYDYGIIASALRCIFPGMSRYYDSLFAIYTESQLGNIASLASELLVHCVIKCRNELKLPIVALDIAGAENGFENKIHESAFAIAHDHLINKTVHAGEGYGPESITQAIKYLHAERIGHGFHIFNLDMVKDTKNRAEGQLYIDRLVKYVCDRRVCMEVCLTSNLDTMPQLKIEDHAFNQMLIHNCSVTLNTDNRLMSNTTTVKELKLAIDTFGLSPKKVRKIVIDGFKRSFYHGSYSERRAYVRQAIDFYDTIALKYNIQG